ncbi:MAG: 4-(cytidine 5'-diphospho)-2-C-methyl-D-erythritol kinase [Planctomycetaceae bacterium]
MRLIDDGTAVLARSPAKLNLLLAIRGRRADGFHEIETLMLKVSIFDTLRFSSRQDDAIVLRVRRTTNDFAAIPVDRNNLVVRAAELLRERSGVRHGADVVLEKRIPAEAGLAGGSGNAAATLAALVRLWQLKLPVEELAELAGRLGSDVPFFLFGANAAIARGRGEQIEPVVIGGPLHFVIAKPCFGLPTVDVYRTFAERCTPSEARAVPLVKEIAVGRLGRAARLLRNDLMPAAESLRPELYDLRTRLQKECTYGSLMTGSGSACFGLCASAREATTVAARMRSSGAGRAFAATSA